MKTKNLQLQQLDGKFAQLTALNMVSMPQAGWLRSVRTSIGMSLEQMGKKLRISKQSAQAIEKREQEGTLTLNGLKEAAEAMELQLVYALVPKDGSLEELINRRSQEVAKQIVGMGSQTMVLEDQGNSGERLTRAIEERAKEIREKTPKILWD